MRFQRLGQVNEQRLRVFEDSQMEVLFLFCDFVTELRRDGAFNENGEGVVRNIIENCNDFYVEELGNYAAFETNFPQLFEDIIEVYERLRLVNRSFKLVRLMSLPLEISLALLDRPFHSEEASKISFHKLPEMIHRRWYSPFNLQL